MPTTPSRTMTQLSLFPELESTSSPAEAHARTSASPDAAPECQRAPAPAPASPSSTSDWFATYIPASSCGKTCRESSPRTVDVTSPPSSIRWMNSGILSRGVCLTANTPEWTAPLGQSPSDAAVCGLSDVLEATDESLRKYYLSERACSGILRRAAKRGKALPPLLNTALREMIAWWEQQGGDPALPPTPTPKELPPERRAELELEQIAEDAGTTPEKVRELVRMAAT